MVYEMNKSFVKFLIVSTVLMAGILLIPTNIHDAKANPCSDIGADVLVEMVQAGGNAGPAGNGGDGGNAGTSEFGGIGGFAGNAGDGGNGDSGTGYCNC